jgi:beta-glucanase (GH16 family)
VGAGAEVRGARPLAVACAVLLAASLVAAVSRPTTSDAMSDAVADAAPRSPFVSSSTSTTGAAPSTVDTVPLPELVPDPLAAAARKGATSAPTTASVVSDTTVPAPPSSAPPPVPSRPCGGPLPMVDGGMWRCTYSDEFTGSALDRKKWAVMTTRETGFNVEDECFVDDPDNVRVSDGTLKLTLLEERGWFTCSPDTRRAYTTKWSSGMITTFSRWAQTYGRFEVRAKLPRVGVSGVGAAFWLWPEVANRYGPWPLSGEIDFMEYYSSVPDHVLPYIHYVRLHPDGNGGSGAHCPVDHVEQWHLYALEWTPKALTVLIDGKPCLVDEWQPLLPLVHPQPFDQPFTLSLTQAKGTRNNPFDPKTTPLPATTEVDYVRVWQLG